MDHAFSNRLLLLPLFQGFSRLDFLDIVEKIPFDFRNFAAGETLVQQSAESHSLCMILGGEVETIVDSPDHTYRFVEHIAAPWIVQPECLFGLHNRYSHTVKALSETQVVVLSKQSVCRLLSLYPAFQINFYNALSTLAQHTVRLLWQTRRTTVEERFRVFMQRRSLRPFGLKQLHIRMEDLALELGTTRLRISQMLADMCKRELLSHTRGVITVPSLEKL